MLPPPQTKKRSSVNQCVRDSKANYFTRGYFYIQLMQAGHRLGNQIMITGCKENPVNNMKTEAVREEKQTISTRGVVLRKERGEKKEIKGRLKVRGD